MRVVTFQSRNVLEHILNDGIIETVSDMGSWGMRSLSGDSKGFVYLIIDSGRVRWNSNDSFEDHKKTDMAIVKSTRRDRVYPFYSYAWHEYCGTEHSMSLMLVYRLASYFIGTLEYDTRDIIELEVPDEEVLNMYKSPSSCICVLPYIKKEWLVSVLAFETYIDDCAYNENGQLYSNNVYREDTYRMCYSKDVILTGHGYGDDLFKCMSPELINGISKSAIQRDYVQPTVWAAFKVYCYMIRHGLRLSDLGQVKVKTATVEMPAEFDVRYIESFNECKDRVYAAMGVSPVTPGEHYYDRMPGYFKYRPKN